MSKNIDMGNFPCLKCKSGAYRPEIVPAPYVYCTSCDHRVDHYMRASKLKNLTKIQNEEITKKCKVNAVKEVESPIITYIVLTSANDYIEANGGKIVENDGWFKLYDKNSALLAKYNKNFVSVVCYD